jgi:nondiscriminating aspartyl-tRNA synthetase
MLCLSNLSLAVNIIAMERTLVLDCGNKLNETVTISGWVQTRRDHGKIGFLDVEDRSGVIQVFCTGEQLGDLHPQDVVSITGKVAERPEKLVNPNLPTGKIEIQAESIEVLSKAAELPFDMGGKELDLQLPTLLDFRSLTLRHPKVKAIFKVQAAILEGFRKVSRELNCVEIVVPEIVADSTEGGADVFTVDYYGHKVFMTQSPQLYKQMLVPVFERVFTIAHAYRAEPSVTTRHLSVATQMDCEFGFVEFNELLDLLEKVGSETIKHAQEVCGDIFNEGDLKKVAFGNTPRLSLREAQEIIFKEFGRDSRREKDLAPQDEVDICKWALEKHGSDFVTITHFPTKKRAFYTKPDPEDPEYSLSYDLLFRGVEIMSGSQRINDYQELVEAIKGRGMDPKNFELYLQAFKYGMPPEGGFSFGLERMTMHMLNLSNVREASLFPRDMERVDVRLSTLDKGQKVRSNF